MVLGNDMPGRIVRQPGGVAMNIAMALNQLDVRSILLSCVGQDASGRDLLQQAAHMGLVTNHIYQSPDLPTDTYMAVEGENGLIGAIADAHSLEAAGERILDPLRNGSLASAENPWPGVVALDGNLTGDMLDTLATSALFAQADFRIAPASPGKATRLRGFCSNPGATLYLNLEEANLLSGCNTTNARDASIKVHEMGVGRVLVTNGANTACDCSSQGPVTARPPPVKVRRVTGAGDRFMAAHIAAELHGLSPDKAIAAALNDTARFISG